MSKNLIKFGVFKNQLIGNLVKAKDFNDLMENKMSKNQKEFWSEIRFRDENRKVIEINREFIDEQGMSIEDIIQDWICNGDTNRDITVLNPNGAGTLSL